MVIAAKWQAIPGIARAANAVRHQMRGLDELGRVDVAMGALAAVHVQYLESESLLVRPITNDAHNIVALLKQYECLVVG